MSSPYDRLLHSSLRGHAPAPITPRRVCRWLAHPSVDHAHHHHHKEILSCRRMRANRSKKGVLSVSIVSWSLDRITQAHAGIGQPFPGTNEG